MYSSSSTSALQGGGEACSSKQTIVTFDNQASFDSNPSPASLGTFDKSNTIPATHASRDPVQSNPSAVARALSKGITPQHSRNPRVSSHSPLAHSRLHLSTPSHPETWESTCTSRSHGDYSVLPPTPPDDEHVGWNPASQVPLFEKRMNQDICLQMHEAMSMDGSSSGTNSSSPSGRSSNASSSVNGSPTLPTNQMDYRPSIESWLEKGIEAAVSCLPSSNLRVEAVKMVSQMLPYPRTAEEGVKLPTQNSVFCSLVQAVQDRARGKLPYINITHAVPEHFSLSNLPASPPCTPRPQFSVGDYFNSKIFSSAAVVSAYHDFRGAIQTMSPHSPMPIVPPQSVHVSVLERYLPPSTIDEYRDFFRADRPSYLVDRLSELSPDGGSLLLIYPTREGACAFREQYLSPIIDPLIRQLVVVNGMSADLGQLLGSHSCVYSMDSFDRLMENIQRLCQSLSGPGSKFTLAEAGTGSVYLDRDLWSEWYIHQEKKRIKDVLSLNPHESQRPPFVHMHRMFGTEPGMTSSILLAEVFDGIRKRPYSVHCRPRRAIELGVFVIRRSN